MPLCPTCTPPSILTYPGAPLTGVKPNLLSEHSHGTHHGQRRWVTPAWSWQLPQLQGKGGQEEGAPLRSQQVPAQTRSLQPLHLSVNPQH